MKKNHMFKARTIKEPKIRLRTLAIKHGIYTFHKFRFELRYFRVIFKIFKRVLHKPRIIFRRERCWCFIRKNFILTMKSKNSRMGAGVGNLVRLTCVLKPGTAVLLFNFCSFFMIKACAKFLVKRFNIPLRALTGGFW